MAVLNSEKLSIKRVTHEGRMCYRLEEVIPARLCAAYVQILDAERDLVLLRREKYFDNANRAEGSKLREDYPFDVSTFDYRKDETSGVWLPVKWLLWQQFLTHDQKPEFDQELTTEFADYSFGKPPAKVFTLRYLCLLGAHRLRDDRKGHAEDNWYTLPSPGNAADPTLVPDVKRLPPDLGKQWLKDVAAAQ